ncbi:MAG: GNAT family N-acetyltransferase [Pseudomonadota bacterium]
MAVRTAVPGDAAALSALLNAIIRQGGTTAMQTPFDENGFRAAFIAGDGVLACMVAEAAGQPVGFQFLGRHPALPPGWVDIASFARQAPKLPGVGRALFPRTLERARALGAPAINATIRADNASGLGYYAAMGFRRYRVARSVPLADGTPVDRISMRFDLG